MYKYQSLQAGQLPWEHLYFLQDLLNFIILKKLKQEAHDDFRVYVYERSSCGLFVIWVTNPNGEVPYGLLSRSWFYYPNLIKVSPVTRDRDSSKSHYYETMTSLPPEAEDPIESLEWSLPDVQIWCF